MNATASRRPRALLLDDDPLVLRLVGTALEARGFDVRTATDGERGVAILLDELLELDVLVADVHLPARDAWALLQLVRYRGGERNLGIVVLGDASPPAREWLVALGADEVVGRAHGPAAVADAAVAVSGRHGSATCAPLDAARRCALLAARKALSPGPALDPAPA